MDILIGAFLCHRLFCYTVDWNVVPQEWGHESQHVAGFHTRSHPFQASTGRDNELPNVSKIVVPRANCALRHHPFAHGITTCAFMHSTLQDSSAQHQHKRPELPRRLRSTHTGTTSTSPLRALRLRGPAMTRPRTSVDLRTCEAKAKCNCRDEA